jgi:phosphoglycolate phosphatase
MKRALLWDLDGTLTEPRDGIIRSIQYALEKSGRAAPPESELLWTIGPPLQESFATLVPEADALENRRLVELYRERFADVGIFENSVYPGIRELLGTLSEFRHFVATSKPWVYAEPILKRFELAPFFTRIYGAELSGERSNKGELIEHLLRQEGVPPREAVMIGDRKHDILGAKRAGIASIGITWGYGSPEELSEAGADALAASPEELRLRISAL